MDIKKLKNHTEKMRAIHDNGAWRDLKAQTDHVKALALVSIAESLAELVTRAKEEDDDETR